MALGGKYNTLPARQVAIIEAVYSNQEQAPLIPAATDTAGPKSILVKKVGDRVDMGVYVYCLYIVSLLY